MISPLNIYYAKFPNSADYFLLRNGEFGLSLIREIERLKHSRLTSRSSSGHVIREQDLNHTILRASVGTSAQHDPALARLRFLLPSGPVRPLLPLLDFRNRGLSGPSMDSTESNIFLSHLLGTTLTLVYDVAWPLDLFLYPIDLDAYAALFSYLSAIRKTHTRVHGCWTSLSNAQRARRLWTGHGEGGTAEDLELRSRVLRCGWGVVRDMEWFLNTLLGYIMTDVIDLEFRQLKETLSKSVGDVPGALSGRSTPVITPGRLSRRGSEAANNPFTSSGLDFTTLRTIHESYLDRLLTGSLLTNQALTVIIKSILDICEGFVAQVERWGGDVLPALLFEGSIDGEKEEVGSMVKERWTVVEEIQLVGQVYIGLGGYECANQCYACHYSP
jgi:gamma-tubulin complex component 4